MYASLSSSSKPAQTTALIPYPPVSAWTRLQIIADQIAIRSFERAKFASKHLYSLEGRLCYLAENIQKLVPFPFSGTIAFQVGGTTLQTCHFPHQQKVLTPQQTFNVLSVGKLFTAIAIVQLIEAGKFTLKTPLSKLLTAEELNLLLRAPYLGQKPSSKSLAALYKQADKVTIEHLLTHTAGFYRWWIPDPSDPNLDLAAGESFNPKNIGKFEYSNFGYQLLGTIIAKYSDAGIALDYESGFRNHIEKRIFKPAGMLGALKEIHSPMQPADCFEFTAKGLTKVTEVDPYPHGNGCWRMSASDLLAFNLALRQPNLLIGEHSLRTMLFYKPRALCFWVDRDQPSGPVKGWGHPGGGPGMSAFMHTWQTTPPVTAVVLSNSSECAMTKLFLDPLFE